MCETDTYISECWGSGWLENTFNPNFGTGICGKCLKKSTFWDKYDNKEYEDGEYYN